MTKKSENSIDDQITELFGILESQKEAVEHSKREIARGWVTNGSLQITGQQPISIVTASHDTLIHAVSQVLMYEAFAMRAATELGISSEVKIGGYSPSSWIKDCKKRLAALEISNQKAKLTSLEARLSLIISPEQRRELELNAIRKELGNA